MISRSSDDPALWADIPRVVNDLARETIGHALAVHSALGPGLLERPYKLVLADRLAAAGHAVRVEHPMAIFVDGRRIEAAYVADIVVDDTLLVEVKSVQGLHPNMIAQVKT